MPEITVLWSRSGTVVGGLWVQGQPGLHSETLSQKNFFKEKINNIDKPLTKKGEDSN
jgi:hypothetical protein